MNPFETTAVPKATRRNPFKPGDMLAKQYDGMLRAYSTAHPDVILNGARCMGNSFAAPFWRGYDGASPGPIAPRGSLAWACYRAGQTQRLLDNDRGVFVPLTAAGRKA